MVTSKTRTIRLPADLVESIEKYSNTNWNHDPSKIGALNMVAHIGERVVSIVNAAVKKSVKP